LGSDQATSEEVDVPNDRVLTRGDRRRNEKLTRLRSIVRRDFAILGVDLASAKQAAVLTDHDSVVVGRRMFTGDAWVIDDILDWAGRRSWRRPGSPVSCSGVNRRGIGGSRCWTGPGPAEWSWCV
jgi:hypothetical protein